MAILTGIKNSSPINNWDFEHVQSGIEPGNYILHDGKNFKGFFKSKQEAIDYGNSNDLIVDQISSIVSNKITSIPIDKATIN